MASAAAVRSCAAALASAFVAGGASAAAALASLARASACLTWDRRTGSVMINVRLSHLFCSAERAAWNSAGKMVQAWNFLRLGFRSATRNSARTIAGSP